MTFPFFNFTLLLTFIGLLFFRLKLQLGDSLSQIGTAFSINYLKLSMELLRSWSIMPTLIFLKTVFISSIVGMTLIFLTILKTRLLCSKFELMCYYTVDSNVGTGDISLVLGIVHVELRMHVSPGMDC